jgi:tetraacyldisaccharide 4'-kinase
MAAALQRAWTRRGPLACLLWPLSLVYGLLARVHRGLYRSGVFAVQRPAVPVVVVGNVVAGGAGKTPVVMALVEHLQARGLACGVVARGYGRVGTQVHAVRPDNDATQSGDEPLLVARRCGVPVFVGARRADAAAAMLALHPQVQVIVSDDGLQHHAMARDIEICVFDARGTGNGWLLPAGPLRERWPRPLDLVLQPAGPPLAPGAFALQRTLVDHALRSDGARVPLAALQGPCAALAGIAQPDQFFAMLRATGIELATTLALPDHADFSQVSLPAAGVPLLCTEKDAVKLWLRRPDAMAVPLALSVEPAFWQALDRLLEPKLSSPHGSQTA